MPLKEAPNPRGCSCKEVKEQFVAQFSSQPSRSQDLAPLFFSPFRDFCLEFILHVDNKTSTMEKGNSIADVEKSVDDENSTPLPSSPSNAPELTSFQYRKLIWKLDVRLLPPLFCLWFVSLIDRINIGSAAIFGIQKNLGMNPQSNDFNVALVIVTIGLITMEVPSNWLLKKTSPSVILGIENFLLGMLQSICSKIRISDSKQLSSRFAKELSITKRPCMHVASLWVYLRRA